MKTIKSIMTLAVMAMCMITTNVQPTYATVFDPHSVDIPTFVVQSELAPKKVSLVVANLQKRPTKVSIENAAGKVLFKATVRNRNAYGKVFDMRNLKDGTYRLIIDQGKGQKIVEPIKLQKK